MKLNKEWDGLKQIANGDYVLEGDLISEETIEIELDDRLIVRGKVVSKKYIKVQRTLIAGLGIKAGCGIEAGEGIEAGSFIHCEKRIFAGVSVYHTNGNCIKTITCAELRKGEICFGDLVITKVEETVKTFKVVCVEYKRPEQFFTIGKVYTWENGTLTNDRGFTYSKDKGANVTGTDPDKWGLSKYYKFIKIIEEKEGK